MLVEIRGRNLPGRDVGEHTDVHVGVQVGRDAAGLVAADAPSAIWRVEVDTRYGDFRGPAVHGRKGDRFLYLAWGVRSPVGDFTMFRRAELMLNRVDPVLVASAERSGRALVARVDLTDARGGPIYARVDPPAVRWTLGQASGARSL